MRIIISPAKKMNIDTDSLNYENMPDFIEETKDLLSYLKKQSYEDLKGMWKCSDKIATENVERLKDMDVQNRLTPGILAFEGIQYQYMAPGVFETQELQYIEKHLRILSGFYGIIRPFDGVVPYRLEMGTKLRNHPCKNLYEFWGDKLAKKITSETEVVVNLASKEYSKAITAHLGDNVKFVTCVFGELIDDKVVEKGTLAKMARGEMVRFMAEGNIQDLEGLKGFHYLDYTFAEELSDEKTFTFIKASNP